MFLRLSLVLLLVFTSVAPLFTTVQAIAPASVVINELMWMGSSASSADEWIELRNITQSPVDISGWKLSKQSGDDASLMLSIPENEAIPALGYYLIANYAGDAANSHLNITPDLVDTDVALVNSGMQISLYNDLDQVIDVADDGAGKPLAGDYVSGEAWKSMERVRLPVDGTQAADWKSSSAQVNFDPDAPEYGTPGAENSNAAPIAEAGDDMSVQVDEVATFDATLSHDPDNDPLTYVWDFGDGSGAVGSTPTHAYDEQDSYTVTLTLSDGTLEAEDTLRVTVLAEPILPTPDNGTETPPSAPLPNEETETEYMSGNVVINEVFPNPNGKDQEAEFIELYNRDAQPVSLAGWKLTNDKTSHIFTDQVIAAGAFFAIPYSSSKVLLRNSGGVVRLVDPFGVITSGVEYPAAEEAMSFARLEEADRWEWTELPTPGSENEIERSSETATRSESEEAAAGEGKTKASESTSNVQPESVQVSDIAQREARTLVQLEGVVTVTPGMFSVSSFWLQDESGATEVSSTNKLFPDLQLGDVVRVVGMVSSASDGLRINQRKDEIEIVGKEDLLPTDATLQDLDESATGLFVSLSGKVSKSSKTKLTLQDESGALFTVSAKKGTGLNLSSYSTESSLQVSGIVSWSADGLQLLPRIEQDIQLAGEVLGELSEEMADDILLTHETAEVRDGRSAFPTWIVLGVILAMVFAGGWWYWRYRKRTSKELA